MFGRFFQHKKLEIKKDNKTQQFPVKTNLPNMKILLMADFHMLSNDEFRQLSNLQYGVDYDICFLLGDIELNDLKDIQNVIRNIYGVTGNHDAKDLLKMVGIEDVNGKAIDYNGIRIAGLGGSFKYKDNDYMSMLTQQESSYICNNLPAADIFITHDSGHYQVSDEYAHQGLVGITEYIERNKPALHFYGHHHENSFDLIGNTNSFCVYKCSILDTETMEIQNLF